MADPHELAFDDLFAIDRRVRVLAGEVAAAERAVARGEDDHPFDKPSRQVLATLASWRELAARPVIGLDEPLKAGVLRWVHAFLLARVSHARRLDVAEQRLEAEPGGLGYARALRDLALGTIDGDRVTAQRTVAARRASVLRALDGRDELVAEAGRRSVGLVGDGARASRAHGQGEERRFDDELPCLEALRGVSDGALDDAAKRFRMDRDGVSVRPRNLAFFDGLLGRDAHEGWPARHLEAWLADSFRELLRVRRPASLAIPGIAGASSFVRLVGAFGAAWTEAAVPAGTPFALAYEPLAFRPRVARVAFALLVASDSFQRRALGLSGDELPAQLRALRRSLWQAVHVEVVRAELDRRGLRAGSREREELAEARFLGHLEAPVASAITAPGDGFALEVLLHGVNFATAARDALDEDWFRNPRAGAWLEEHLGALVGPYPRLVDAAAVPRKLRRLLGEHYA